MAVASAALSSDFADETLITGLTEPTNLEFAPDGRLFVTEKSGLIKVFDSVDDTSATVFADLRPNVHNFWDRGLLGLALHPDFPSTPYVYVLYTYGVPLSGETPEWGDTCPSPPGATTDGCVVSGRLSRLVADGDVMTGSEVVLIEDWCQQYPSHSIGDLAFGQDGALYVTSGDGASFNWTDYGQGGGGSGSPTPVNPCDDPPGEGGALRSQDLRTEGDPVTLDGTILRVDPLTGGAMADNPAFPASDENKERIIAHGLRNPFRMAIDPGSGAVYVGDVGWNTWEEVNRVDDPTGGVPNFGWPCYEGGNGTSIRHGGYDTANLQICENLYVSTGAVTAPFFAYHHDRDITGSDDCPPANPPQGTSSSISGLAFYDGGDYPGAFNGALFGSDYSRNCIWVIYRDASGDLDPGSVEVFQPAAPGPADLEIGPNGDLYYASISQGQVRRIRFVGDNTPPVASIDADVFSGSAPLTVNFDGSGSTDSDLDDLVGFHWDLDGDGQYDDATGPEVTWTFADPGSYPVRLRVTDARGETGNAMISIQASNSPPVATITAPAASTDWRVGEIIAFTGRGDDPDQGQLSASALTWEIILHHCETDGTCHEHLIQTLTGVSGGSFVAPDHEYPSWLELRLTARDQFGVEDIASVELDPELVDLVFEADPAGLEVAFAGEPETTPFARTVIVGATVEIATQPTQAGWVFQGWSNGGPRVQAFAAPASETTYTAWFDEPPVILTESDQGHPENQVVVVDIEATDNADSEAAGLAYTLTAGADMARFGIDTATGVLRFLTPPDYESPSDSGGDNRYEVEVTLTDSSGLSASKSFTIEVVDVDEPPISAAGLDRAVVLGGSVSLDGSASSDPEGESLDFQWVVSSRPATSTATISGSTNQVATFVPDRVGGYVVRLEVGDGTHTVVDTLSIQVETAVSPNKAPEIVSGGGGASATYTIDEGQVDVADVESTDPDGDIEGNGLSYAISGGADSGSFQIGAGGVLQFKSPPEYENPTNANGDNIYVVVVGVTDSGGLSDSQEIRVRVRELDKPHRDSFRDDDTSQFETAIEWMAAEGITLGCNPPANDRFCPDDFVTRGQMAAFFARGFGWSDVGGGDLFVDDDGLAFERAIDLMGTAGVTRGCNPPANDRFCPDDFVTRGQMAAFFRRAFN